MSRVDDLQAKKQLLIAQAEFDRLKLAMAVHDVRRLARPSLEATHAPRSLASRALAFALPLIGTGRAGAIVRGLTVAVSVYRFVRGFR